MCEGVKKNWLKYSKYYKIEIDLLVIGNSIFPSITYKQP